MSAQPRGTGDESWAPRRLLRAAALIYSLRFGAAIVSIVTGALLAFHFGIGKEIEAYFAAITVFHMSSKFVQAGNAGNVLVPIFTRLRERGPAGSEWRLATDVLNTTLVLGMIVGAGVAAGAPWIARAIAPGFDAEGEELLIGLLRLAAIGAVVGPIMGMGVALLNAQAKFGSTELFAVVGAIGHVTVIAVLVPSMGIQAAAVGLVVSSLLNAGLIFTALYRQGYRHRWFIRIHDDQYRAWARAMRPYAVYTVVVQFQTFLLIAVLSLLPEGNFAIYRYGADIAARITTFVAGPVNSLALPLLSRSDVMGGVTRLGRELSRSMNVTILLTAPALAIVIIGSRPIVELLLARGEFTEIDVRPVSVVLVIMAVGLVVNPVLSLATSSMVAVQRTGWVNIVAVFGQVYQFVLLISLAPAFGYVGAAWHSTGATIAVLLTAHFVVRRIGIRLERDALIEHLLRAVAVLSIATLLGAGAGWMVRHSDFDYALLELVAIAGVIGTLYVGLGALVGVGQLRWALLTALGYARRLGRDDSPGSEIGETGTSPQ